jgi:drug/metabolite transporter (DMT)-like permease
VISQSAHSSGLARGYSAALLSAVALSTTGIFIRYLTQTYQMPALVLAFWRDIFASLTLIAGLAIFAPKLLVIRRSQLPYLVFFGFMLSVFNSFWTLSVTYNGASVATVLAYSSTAFTALLGRWLLKEQLDRTRIAGIVVCILGCGLVSQAFDGQVWGTNLLGIITGLMTGLVYAVYTLLGKNASQRGLSPWTTLAYIFGFASVFLLLFNLLGGLLPGSAATFNELLLDMDSAGWGILFALAAGPTVLGFVLYNISLIYLTPNLSNLVLTSEPAFTSVSAFFVLSERLDFWQISGSVLILAAVLYLRLHEGRKEKRALLRSMLQEG